MLKGIDISHHQGSPDFKRIRAAGIKFVILKATEGVNYTDPCFHTNIKAALAAGLPVGAYHFLRATPLNWQKAWTAYKDALRDVPEQGGFPYTVNWPIIPKATEEESK